MFTLLLLLINMISLNINKKLWKKMLNKDWIMYDIRHNYYYKHLNYFGKLIEEYK